MTGTFTTVCVDVQCVHFFFGFRVTREGIVCRRVEITGKEVWCEKEDIYDLKRHENPVIGERYKGGEELVFCFLSTKPMCTTVIKTSFSVSLKTLFVLLPSPAKFQL